MQRQRGSEYSNIVKFLFSVVLACLAFRSLAIAQGAPNDYQIGFPPNGDFSGTDFENVQVNNGNLHIEIPLWSTTGRGPSVAFKYVYDSLGWDSLVKCNRISGSCDGKVLPTSPRSGVVGNHLQFTLVGPLSYQFKHVSQIYTCNGTQSTVYLYSYNMAAPDGTHHHFVPDPIEAGPEVVYCDGYTHPNTLYADDGSGWLLNVNQSTAAITNGVSKDGTVVFDSAGSVLDTNGNQVNTTDTLGRPINTGTSYYDSNGVPRTIAATTVPVPIKTNLCQFVGADTCTEYSSTWNLIQTLQLPNGMSYTFTYSQSQCGSTNAYYGQPCAVTLPTGGTITWGWTGERESGPVLVTRQLSGDPGPWKYSGAVPYNTSNVTDPANNDTVTTFGGYIPYPTTDTSTSFQVIQKQYYQGSSTSGTLIKTIQTDYTTGGAILPIHETTTWNQQNLVSRTETDYDSWAMSGWSGQYASASNPIEKREFDYGTGSWGTPQVRTTDYGYLHLSNSTYLGLNILDKETSKKVYAGSSGSGTLTAQTLNTYDGVAISGNTSSNPAPNHDYTNFSASYNYRGNLTQVSKGLKSGSTWTWLNTNKTYNDLGEVLTSKDPAGNTTTYDYTDAWATINNPQCVTSAHSYGFPTTITDALTHQTKHSYYSCTSLTGSTQDANDIAASRAGTTFTYDLMHRLTATNFPDGGQTTTSFNDTTPYTATTTQLISSTLNKVTATVHDGLGRVQRTQLVDPDCSSGPVKVDHTYGWDTSPPAGVPGGKLTTVSNPYCTTSDSTYGITTTLYDELERPVLVVPPDGTTTSNNVSTVYAGNATTVTDQAGAARKNVTDGLGRMTYVYEDPANANYETDYTYDVLDDLTGVIQKGGSTSGNWRSRSFQYDSLGRLTQATNPESGTISYSYDADSNLFQKVSPQANQQGSATTTITYCYDADNRVASKTYSAQTCPVASPAVSFLYDQSSYNNLTITNGIGRRTGMSDQAGVAAWSFDPMGRVAAEQRTLNSTVTKQFSFNYYQDGELNRMVVPAQGDTITYTPNAAGRTISAVENLNNRYNFVTAATYAPQGALAGATIGFYSGSYNGTLIANTYNKRLQPSTITASLPSNALVQSLTYNFNLGTADNGNVYSITNGKDATRSQTFTYDKLNRITTATTQGTSGPYCWGQKFGYMSNGNFVLGPDPWGNVTQIQSTQCSAFTLNQGINTNNQFSAGMVYDSAGNLINDGSHPYTYDPENRLLTAGGVTYTYDGDGKRVMKSSGTIYWTGPGWNPLVETDLTGRAAEEYVFFNGERVARIEAFPPRTVEYYFSDHLKSTDIVTNATGGIVHESDYVPYGSEVVISGTDPNHYKFTGKERDSESNLDSFGARYYSAAFGRFITPDWAAKPVSVPYATFVDPQTLNLYAYVRNNPLLRTDPDGHCDSCKKFWNAFKSMVSVKFSSGVGREWGGSVAGLKLSAGAAVKTETKSYPFSNKPTEVKDASGSSAKLKVGPFSAEVKNPAPTVNPETGKIEANPAPSGSVGVGSEHVSGLSFSNDHEVSLLGASGTWPPTGGITASGEIVLNTDQMSTAARNAGSALIEGLSDLGSIFSFNPGMNPQTSTNMPSLVQPVQ